MRFTILFAALGFMLANPVLAQLPAVIAPPENPITEEKRVLGKILFWDEQLSSDDTVACGTCHIPSAGGGDPRSGIHPGADELFGTDDDVVGSPGVVRQLSTGELIDDVLFGFNRQVTGRAAPSNIMAMYAESLFWDGRAEASFNDPQNPAVQLITSGGALENQAVGPILSDVEMAHVDRTWEQVTAKLEQVAPLALASNIPTDMATAIANNTGGYSALFANAFGDQEISAARIGMAIATYQRTLVPDQSPWDRYQAGDESAMTSSQIAGWEDFRDNTVCDNCHVPPEFTDNLFHNIGLRPATEDIGLQEVTGSELDFGRFKTPTLRNSGLKSSLMHVGFITSVRDAIDFYNAEADTANGIPNRHIQFIADQTGIPTENRDVVEYNTLSMFSQSETLKNQVADFIASGLTDPRVAAETFPFDRPTLASERPANNSEPALVNVMTYNVNTIGWTQARANLISQVILEEAPDLVSLQEAGTTPLPDLVDSLGGDYQVFNFPESPRNTNVILVKNDRFNIVSSGITTADEMLFCVQDRYVVFVVLEEPDSGNRFTIYNTQFCSPLTAEDRLPVGFTALEVNEAHAVTLANTIATNISTYGGVTLVAADLNANINSDTMSYLLDQTAVSFGAPNPVELDDTWELVNSSNKFGVDWILVAANQASVFSAEFIDNELTQTASDHLPLTAEIQWLNAPAGDNTAGPLTAGPLEAEQDIAVAVGNSDNVMLRFGLDSNDGRSQISAITLQASGTGDDSEGPLMVKLILDENGDGLVDSGEPLLGQGNYATDDGQLRLQLTQPLALPAGTTEFLVIYDF